MCVHKGPCNVVLVVMHAPVVLPSGPGRAPPRGLAATRRPCLLLLVTAGRRCLQLLRLVALPCPDVGESGLQGEYQPGQGAQWGGAGAASEALGDATLASLGAPQGGTAAPIATGVLPCIRCVAPAPHQKISTICSSWICLSSCVCCMSCVSSMPPPLASAIPTANLPRLESKNLRAGKPCSVHGWPAGAGPCGCRPARPPLGGGGGVAAAAASQASPAAVLQAQVLPPCRSPHGCCRSGSACWAGVRRSWRAGSGC